MYRDAPTAIRWLCDAFGFEQQMVVPNPDGTIAHAELRLGGGMVMLGSVKPTEYGRLIKQPDEIGGFETQAVYLVVKEPDAIYEHVKKMGGQIVLELKDQDYGSRDFTCRDPEGHLWNLGTYDPWAS